MDLTSPPCDTNLVLRLSVPAADPLVTHLAGNSTVSRSKSPAMNMMEFQLQGVSDPRLAAHATSALPAWLWSTDGRRILWANPVGAEMFGATDSTELARKTLSKTLGPADPHRRQVGQLAPRLPPNGMTRLERLRGFGARPGMLVTCACTRLAFFD